MLQLEDKLAANTVDGIPTNLRPVTYASNYWVRENYWVLFSPWKPSNTSPQADRQT